MVTTLASIKKMMAADATVIHGGVEVKVPASDIVLGDVILLSYGYTQDNC